MIDSGATHSFVNAAVVERLGVKPVAGSVLHVTLADKSIIVSDSRIELDLVVP